MPIPQKIRQKLASDPRMKRCCMPNCARKEIEWDHSFNYAGKSIQEAWAINPLCQYHHRGANGTLQSGVREWTEYISLQRAEWEDLAKYPRKNWPQLVSYLKGKYEGV